MKKIKNTLFYISTIGGFSLLMYLIVLKGQKLEAGREIFITDLGINYWSTFLKLAKDNIIHPLAILIVQMIIIILMARLFGWICRKIGQPSVVGEILAGIVLGPSLLGLYYPEFSAVLFSPQSLGNLQVLSQIGLVLFMFIVGLELELKVLKSRINDAIVISHASIIFPFALGMGLAYFIYPTFAPENTPFMSFGLFLGIAMSITAFPVLARIVQERGIHKTALGSVVITSAAADDITAWCILAAVIAIVNAGSFISSLFTIALAVIYVFIMLLAVKPFLKRIGDLHASRESLSKPVVAIFFLVLLISSYTTEIIGIHALFGAFMAGVVMPDNLKFRNIFIGKIEDIALVLLMPLFFVYTGLRTEIGVLNDLHLWVVCGWIILVAVVGKFAGGALSARFVGQSWYNSLIVGSLMNTRGLMQLVVLNIGYELGVLSSEIFAMMIIMALVTTIMTGPALVVIDKFFKKKKTTPAEDKALLSKHKILISFGNPEMGRTLLRLANSFTKSIQDKLLITVLHLCPNSVLHNYNQDEYEKESFTPVVSESHRLDQQISLMFKASEDIDSDIVDIANKGDYKLLLIGIGHSIFEGTLLGNIFGFTSRILRPDRFLDKFKRKNKFISSALFDDRTRYILTNSKIPVGVFINKNLVHIEKVFIPVFSANDGFIVQYARQFVQTAGVHVTLLDSDRNINSSSEFKDSIEAILVEAQNEVSVLSGRAVDNQLLNDQDLIVVSLNSWKQLITDCGELLKNSRSVLILKP